MRYTVDGRAVIVPARVALLVERYFGAAAWQRLRDELYVRRDVEACEVLRALHAEALLVRESVTCAPSASCGSTVAERAEVAAPSSVMTTTDVAIEAGCTDRAVRMAAREGRLLGRLEDRRWVFDRSDVAEWLASRPAA